MLTGKPVLFAAGIAAGAALMFAVQQNDKSDVQAESRPDIVVNTAPVTQPVSPFAPVEEPPTQTEEVVATATETISLTDEQSDLLTRVTEAELRIRELEMALEEITTDVAQPEPPEDEPENTDLILAGFEPAAVEEIEFIRDQAQLARLELRDQATREGWINR